MRGQRRSAQQRPRGRDEAVQDEGGLAGPGRPGQRGQPADREGGGDAVQIVKVADLDGDLPGGGGPRRPVARHGRGAGQERAHDRARVGFQLGGRALGDDRPALRAGLGAELDDPVRAADDLPLVLYHDHGVSVTGKGGDGRSQPFGP